MNTIFIGNCIDNDVVNGVTCTCHSDYYTDFSLSPDLSARDSNIGPRASPSSDIGRGLIDRMMTKNLCYDPFII